MKNFIIDFLIKRMSRTKNYALWRGLINCFVSKRKTEEALYQINKYLFFKGANFAVWDFTDIFVLGDVLVICTRRPGLWIGGHGSVCDDLRDACKNFISGVRYIEDKYSVRAKFEDAFSQVNNLYG